MLWFQGVCLRVGSLIVYLWNTKETGPDHVKCSKDFSSISFRHLSKASRGTEGRGYVMRKKADARESRVRRASLALRQDKNVLLIEFRGIFQQFPLTSSGISALE